MKEDNKIYELYNRYCPICGRRIKKGNPLHYCSKKDTDKIDKRAEKIEDTEEIEERTYDDRLKEYEDYHINFDKD